VFVQTGSFLNARLPSYACPDRSAFFVKHIAAEAKNVAKKVEDHLAKFDHNTLSYDGWSSKGRDEVYTVHITTPWPRQSYLVEGLQLTGKSTDADTLFDGIIRVSFTTYWSQPHSNIDRSSYDLWQSGSRSSSPIPQAM
jgi:hypothetical protein